MFTDMVGYSAVAHTNEILARSLVNEQRAVVRSSLAKHGGIEHDTAGDGFFIEFSSAVEALNCAVEIQSLLFDRNRQASQERQILLRVGLHLGDIASDGSGTFGNGVNLAARIEPLAPHGGICLTQQMYDQVNGKISGLTYKKLGHRELKNIASGAIIYSVQTPWSQTKQSSSARLTAAKKTLSTLPLFENMNSISSAFLFAVCLACLIGSSFRAYTFERDPLVDETSRRPASLFADESERLDLGHEWLFQLAKNKRESVHSQKPSSLVWELFDPHNTWKHSEDLVGPYWLKKTFSLANQIESPAIVLGQIAGSHRVYLNGQFIGGSDAANELLAYSFASQLLSVSQPNELLVEVDGRSSLNPGLTSLSSVGTFLGDYRDVRAVVEKNQVKFTILRNIFFAISIFIFVIALAYSVFRRSSKTYFYYAFVLLLGSIQLAYFNPLMGAAFDYPFLRFLRALGLILTPVILMSGFLSLDGQKKSLRFEALNNVFAIVLSASAALLLFQFSATTHDFSEHFNWLLGIGIAYALSAALIIFVSALKGRSNKMMRKLNLIKTVFYFAFEIAAVLALATSLKRGLITTLFSPSLRDSIVQLNLMTPFLFALAVMAIATLDHIRQSATAQFKAKRDEFSREVLHLIHDSIDASITSQLVHAKLSSFLKATRSTLYVVDDETGDSSSLKLVNCIGRQLSSGDLSASSLKSHRILSHVLETRTPILIRDIQTDLRFFDRQPGQKDKPLNYRTGSCMVIPLRSRGDCVGLLTFADKDDQSSFSDEDFATALQIASTLALLVNVYENENVLTKALRKRI